MELYKKLGWGSHLPVLMQLMDITSGDVLELGTGIYSTPYLHYKCQLQKRKLVSYESDPEYFKINEGYQKLGHFHTVKFIDDWSKIDENRKWDIVFIDINPDIGRKDLTMKFINNANYIVLHDAETRWDPTYKYSELYPLFKYKYRYVGTWPQTAILSNFKDIKIEDVREVL